MRSVSHLVPLNKSSFHGSLPWCLLSFLCTPPFDHIRVPWPLFTKCFHWQPVFVAERGGRNTLCGLHSLWLPWCLWPCSFCSIDLNVKWKSQYYYEAENRARYTWTVSLGSHVFWEINAIKGYYYFCRRTNVFTHLLITCIALNFFRGGGFLSWSLIFKPQTSWLPLRSLGTVGMPAFPFHRPLQPEPSSVPSTADGQHFVWTLVDSLVILSTIKDLLSLAIWLVAFLLTEPQSVSHTSRTHLLHPWSLYKLPANRQIWFQHQHG